jgi:hypothetical protein
MLPQKLVPFGPKLLQVGLLPLSVFSSRLLSEFAAVLKERKKKESREVLYTASFSKSLSSTQNVCFCPLLGEKIGPRLTWEQRP